MTSVDAAHCHRCVFKSGKETFYYLHGLYRYDVDRARELVQDGREPVEVEEDSVRASIAESELDEFHLPHVDTSIPGIIAHIHHPHNGEIVRAFVLIDGHHRAARCLAQGLPYRAHLLTEEESQAILLRKPDAEPNGKRSCLSATDAKLGSDAETQTADKHGPRFCRALGAYKWDVSGKRFIDYQLGDGSLLCGHGFAPVVEAVHTQVARGFHLGRPDDNEARWGALVSQLVPSAERVCFTASRTQAVSLAFRIARAYTGRDIILRFKHHEHGDHDETLMYGHDPQSGGLNRNGVANVALVDSADPAEIRSFLEKGRTAAVILEPGGGGAGALPCDFAALRLLRELTRDCGALLAFDETVSGFRAHPGGIQQLADVRPDLTILGGILCGGLPGAGLVGKGRYMAVLDGGPGRGGRAAHVPHPDGQAHALGVAAGIATLEHIADGAAQEQAAAATRRLVGGVNKAARRHAVDVQLFAALGSTLHIVIGAGSAGCLAGPSELLFRLQSEHAQHHAYLRNALLLEGVDIGPARGWVSTTHTNAAIDDTIHAFYRAFQELRKEGRLPFSKAADGHQ